MIGLTCEICGERFDVAAHEGPQRDPEAADWVAAHTCGGRILADDGEVIRRALSEILARGGVAREHGQPQRAVVDEDGRAGGDIACEAGVDDRQDRMRRPPRRRRQTIAAVRRGNVRVAAPGRP